MRHINDNLSVFFSSGVSDEEQIKEMRLIFFKKKIVKTYFFEGVILKMYFLTGEF